MMTFLDWLTTPWGQGLFVLLVAAWGGAALQRVLQRRRGVAQFAARHRLRVVGTIAPDGRPPYARLEHLKWSVLIANTLEGEWEGFEVAIFDFNKTRHARVTAAIVVAPSVLVSGTYPAEPPFDEVIVAGDLLSVRAPTLLPPSGFAGFLSKAAALARRLTEDAPHRLGDGVPTFLSASDAS